MPADKASEAESLKIGESVARALNQLQASVNALDDTACSSVLKVLENFPKPSAHRRHSVWIE
ncbi:MAG: hypothetical protein WBG38_14305 [Nodosilinea sp.]